jgi:hypothetical protein
MQLCGECGVMSRIPAKTTQAEYTRIFKAAAEAGLNFRIEYADDGRIKSITTIGKTGETNGGDVTRLVTETPEDLRKLI